MWIELNRSHHLSFSSVVFSCAAKNILCMYVFGLFLHSDERKEVFNNNCKNSVLLCNIREKCGLDPAENIDLSDEHGYVKQLHYNLDDYATNFLRDRETCVLLKVNSK